MPLFQGCWQLDNFYKPVDAKRKNITDCYFFYYSACKYGSSCQYRHEPSALGHEVMCSRWLEDRCEDVHCKERHMLIGKRRDRTPCFWENTPFGCKKAHCVFKHKVTIKMLNAESDDKFIDKTGTQDSTENDENMSSKVTGENEQNTLPLQVPSIKIISTDDIESDPIDENFTNNLEASSGIDSLEDSEIKTDSSLIMTDLSETLL